MHAPKGSQRVGQDSVTEQQQKTTTENELLRKQEAFTSATSKQ